MATFSPLFIGEVNVTFNSLIDAIRGLFFQSPIHRGSKCNAHQQASVEDLIGAFSPLFIGEVNVTHFTMTETPLVFGLSVPYSSGK